MTKNEKQLLLKDLCARLPYGVKAQVDGHINPLQVLGVSKLNKSTWAWKKGTYVVTFWNDTKCIDNIVPYLRPMSSMTEEEKETMRNMATMVNAVALVEKLGDWLNSRHFDYRRLIPKGLALEAPEGMYKTE